MSSPAEYLRELAKRLRNVAKPGFQREVGRAMASAALAKVQEGFDRGVDPDGRAWKPTARGGQILVDTGVLRNSVKVRYGAGAAWTLGTRLVYARIHNTGGVIKAKSGRRGRNGLMTFRMPDGRWVSVRQVVMPRRQFLPYPGQMPSRWAKSIKGAADAVWRSKMKGS